MNYSVKISVLGAFLLLGTSVYSQSDSLGMPGDNLDLNAVLSIFKESSSIEDFEKRLNSADTKVNNLDLNGDNQVDYLRVVDYGKDEFHSIVIQDPVSKSESQDVAVIEIVKKDNNTAHVQIVGDETLYGKNYIIEPENQAPLKSASKKSNDAVNDDVYESGNSSSSHVMINVWAWPSVTYIYSPGYAYWVSPWYWGYYPGWYSPWRPYGWYSYHSGFVGYNYGFYGYRRHNHAFPHVHNYYYGRRVSSSYVQKTAPRYNSRRDAPSNNIGNRTSQPRNSGDGNRKVSNAPRTNSSGNNVRTRDQNNQQKQSNTNKTERSTNQRQSQGGNSNQRVNSTPHSGSGGFRSTGGGGRSGGGGSRGSSGGGSRGGGGGHR